MGVIERTQNKALRLITGQVQNTDVGVLRVEAGITSFKTNAIRNCLRSHEKAHRLPDDHPRRLALAEATPRRNNRQSWFSRAPSVSKYFNITLPIRETVSIRRYTRDPWSYPNNFSVFNTLVGISNKDISSPLCQAAAAERITTLGPDIVIYTDGSAIRGYIERGLGGCGCEQRPSQPQHPRDDHHSVVPKSQARTRKNVTRCSLPASGSRQTAPRSRGPS